MDLVAQAQAGRTLVSLRPRERAGRDWRDRPLRAGNSAVPVTAADKDLEQWTQRELETYLINVGGDADKVRFLVRQTEVDVRPPIAHCAIDTEVNAAVAALACHRADSPCAVRRPGDCGFFIPKHGIHDIMRRVAQSRATAFDRLSDLDRRSNE